MTATLTLVRHGETVGQSSVRLYGATDVALSATGVAQIEAVAACLRHEPLAALIASPLQRSRVAAEIVAAAQPRPPAITTVAEFTEVDFGAWEGLTFDEVAARDPEGLRRFHAEGLDFTYPGGEQRRHLWARVRSAALRELAPARGHVAAVLHKGVIKAALAASASRPRRPRRCPSPSAGSIASNAVWMAVGTSPSATRPLTSARSTSAAEGARAPGDPGAATSRGSVLPLRSCKSRAWRSRSPSSASTAR